MVVGAIGGRTEVAVIGSGPGGYVAALRAADAGLDVTLIERQDLGGVCLNVGCIPSKTLIETADLVHRSAQSPAIAQPAGVDMGALRGELQRVTGELRQGVAALLEDAGVSVEQGTARFARHDRLVIERDDAVTHLDFDHAIVATGSTPLGIEAVPFGERVVDSTGALALTEVPDHLAIVGAGYIGIELGTAFAKLGSRVTFIEAAPSILPGVPQPLRRPVERRLSQLGVVVHTGVSASSWLDPALTLSDGTVVPCDRVVIAVGRRPNGAGCSIDVAGGAVDDSGFIVVDDELRATRSVSAIGDVIRGPALAHRASNDAERVVGRLVSTPAVAPSVVPAVIFSDPEIAIVGESIDGAADRGLSVHRFPHAASARARTIGVTEGDTWLVADAAGTVVGMHAVGPHASELAGEAVTTIEMAATLDDLSLMVRAHPTMAETVAEAALVGLGHPLHVRR